MRSCNLALCLPFHNERLGNNAFMYLIILSDFRLYISTRRVPIGRDWSIDGYLFAKNSLVARVSHPLFTCHLVSYSCRTLFTHEVAGILFFPHSVFNKIPVIVPRWWYPAWDCNTRTVALWKVGKTVRPLPVPELPVHSNSTYRATLWMRNPGPSRRFHT